MQLSCCSGIKRTNLVTNRKLCIPQDDQKYCNAPHCARPQSFSVSSPLSVCSFVHGFLLFTVMPNTFMIIGGKFFFSCSFCSSFFTAQSWGPCLNSSTHVYLEDFLFMVCHRCLKHGFARRSLLPEIPEVVCAFLGRESFLNTPL